MSNFNAPIAKDDLLWIKYGVVWDPNVATGITDEMTVRGLLISPTKFIASHKILVSVKPGSGQPVFFVPRVPPRAQIQFKGIAGNSPTAVGVEGIHDSSIITVRMDSSGSQLVPVGIPPKSKIRITMVANDEPFPGTPEGWKTGRAYLHWEISPNDPEDYTTPTEVANHVRSSLLNPSKIIDNYTDRLKTPYTNAQVFFVDRNGEPLTTQPPAAPFTIAYLQSRELTCELVDPTHPDGLSVSDLKARGGGPGIISCNVDIGLYRIDPETGAIEIIIDTTIVKVY